MNVLEEFVIGILSYYSSSFIKAVPLWFLINIIKRGSVSTYRMHYFFEGGRVSISSKFLVSLFLFVFHTIHCVNDTHFTLLQEILFLKILKSLSDSICILKKEKRKKKKEKKVYIYFLQMVLS